MTRKFNLLQLFSLVDGRLSFSGMDSVYEILGFVCQFEGIMTHHLPTAMDYIKKTQPDWFVKVGADLDDIKAQVGNDYQALMDYIQKNNTEYEIPQIPNDKVQEFGDYMINNSALLRKK